jgi:hypothetical protein
MSRSSPGSKDSLPEALLIYPPIYDFALFDLYLKPYGLLRLGSRLESAGWKTRIINALNYRDAETCRKLGKVKRGNDGTGKLHRAVVPVPGELRGIKRKFARYGILPEVFWSLASERRPDAVFIATGMTYWYIGVAEAVRLIRGIWKGVPVITGGVYSTLLPNHCESVCAPDYNAAGRTGADMDRWLRNKGLPGVGSDGGGLPMVTDLWNDAAVLRLNEGCPLNCDYCASRKICGGFIGGNAETVFEWLKRLNQSHGTVNFAFYDDALLYKSADVLNPFLEMVIDYQRTTGRRLNFYTPNAIHIRFLDQPAARLMKAAGFREIRLGFESEQESFHNEHDNKCRPGGLKDAVMLLTEEGFNREDIIVYILAGLPGQTADEVEETIRFAAKEWLTLSVSEFSPVPGSDLWDSCVEKCRFPLAEEPLFHNNSFFPMEWDKFTREDMQRLKNLSKQAAY